MDNACDIFSELPDEVFYGQHNSQEAAVMRFLRALFRDRLLNYRLEYKENWKTPKFTHRYDEEIEAEIIQMMASFGDRGDATLYFVFEKDFVESNFGMIWNDSKHRDYYTHCGNLYLNTSVEFSVEMVDFIFKINQKLVELNENEV